jgi:hypothetical protein
MKYAGLHNGLSKFDNGRPKLPRVKLQEINASPLKFVARNQAASHLFVMI